MAKLYKFAICDDDEIYAKKFKEMIEDYFFNSFNTVSIDIFDNANSLLETKLIYDYLLLDIEMPFMNGIELKERLQAENVKVGIIFITNYQEYMEDAFGRNVVAYINKDEITKLTKILSKIEREDNEVDTIEIVGNVFKLKNILYLEANGSNTIIITKNNKSQTFGIYLNELHQRIHSDVFVRSHKSYVVNLTHVINIRYDYIILSDKSRVPLSRTYIDNFKNMYMKYIKDI